MSTGAEEIITHDEAMRRGRWVAAYTDVHGKECRVRVELAEGPAVRNFRYMSAE